MLTVTMAPATVTSPVNTTHVAGPLPGELAGGAESVRAVATTPGPGSVNVTAVNESSVTWRLTAVRPAVAP